MNASEVQEVVKESQQNSKPTTSEAASTQPQIVETEATPDQPDSEDNIISEKPLLEKTVSGPTDSEVPGQNAGDTIELGTVKDKEPHSTEYECKDDESGEIEISPQKDDIPHIRNYDALLISEKPLEKTGPEPAGSEKVPTQNAGEMISDMPVESGIVRDKEPQHKEDEHVDGESGKSEISPQGRPSMEAKVGMPVAEAQSLEDVKLASEQVGEEFKKPPDLSTNETKEGDSEHKLVHRSSVPNENTVGLSKSVQEDHSEYHHEEAPDKKDLPDSSIDDPKQSPQPKPWWNRFGST